MQVELNEELVTERIAEIVRCEVSERIDSAVRGAVKGAVDAAMKDITDERLRAEVEKVLAEGWQKTNNYGEPVGQPITLKALILSRLTEEAGDYNRREQRSDKVVREVVEETLRKEFGKELDAARKSFRDQLGGALALKLREQLAAALGVQS